MNHNELCTPTDHHLSRRQWLGTAAAVLSVRSVSAVWLRRRSPKKLKKDRRQVLFVWLDGGMSQLESWDPKPNTHFGGPFRAIPTTVPGIHVSELLPQSAKQMHHLAIVRSLCTQDNSHSAGVDRIQRGDPKNRGVVYPYFGSAVAKLLGPGDSGLPPYVWVKPMSGGFIYKDAGFLGPKYGALALGDGKPPENLLRPTEIDPKTTMPSATNSASWPTQRYAANRRKEYTEANSYVFDMAAQLAEARSNCSTCSKLPQKDQERYGTHDLGRHMLLARRLLEAGVTFVKVTSYGWDTHGDNFNGAASLHPKFDQPFAAIIEDLRRSRHARQRAGDRDDRVRPHAADQRPHRPRPLAGGVERVHGRPRHQRRASSSARPTTRAPRWRPIRSTSATCSTPGSTLWASTRRRRNTTTTASRCRSPTRT